MEIYEITKKFPKEETYSLTDQIRRSSRSVCTCIGEAYRKRMYPAHFISKCSDADAENTETQIWLDFSLACKYITQEQSKDLIAKSEEVGRLINHMIENPEKYLTIEDKKKLAARFASE
jgi:four helix bundle protein